MSDPTTRANERYLAAYNNTHYLALQTLLLMDWLGHYPDDAERERVLSQEPLHGIMNGIIDAASMLCDHPNFQKQKHLLRLLIRLRAEDRIKATTIEAIWQYLERFTLPYDRRVEACRQTMRVLATLSDARPLAIACVQQSSDIPNHEGNVAYDALSANQNLLLAGEALLLDDYDYALQKIRLAVRTLYACVAAVQRQHQTSGDISIAKIQDDDDTPLLQLIVEA